MRHNFVELLVRVAKAKYIDKGVEDTVHDAFIKLMDTVILPNYVWDDWSDFRTKSLWTLEVDDVFVANREGVRKLHLHYIGGRKRYMSKADAVKLMTHDCPEPISEKEATYCFGMSKMTVIKETANAAK